MPPIALSGPNAEQIRYWNDQPGQKWVDLEALIEGQIAPLGERAMDETRVAPGERVLDVGCGCGQSSLQLGARVGAAGAVVGIDISTPMLERARQRVRKAGLSNVRFENADAQGHGFGDERFDLLFSRFGVMFFAQPEKAFANLASALRPSGRLAFVCWQELRRNPWMLVPVAAAAAHVALPTPPPEGAPGPFSFADPARVSTILEAAGFDAVRVAPLEGELRVGGGGGVDAAVDFLSQMGPAGAALREADEATRARAVGAVRDALAPFSTPDGVRMTYAAWIVTARV